MQALRIMADLGAVSLSTGTHRITDKGYHEGSVIPRLPWRRATDGDFRLDPHVRWARGSTVAVVQTDGRLLDVVRKIGLDKVTPSQLPLLLSRPHVKRMLDDATESLWDFSQNSMEPLVIGFHSSRPGPPTVTVDHTNGKRTGLHVDSWQHSTSLAQRSTSPNRICVNLGQGDRYLVFVGLTLSAIASILNKPTADPSRELGDLFLEAYPGHPIISIRLSPGEAYIAPTENILHDGAYGESPTDLSYHALGHFAPPATTAPTSGFQLLQP